MGYVRKETFFPRSELGWGQNQTKLDVTSRRYPFSLACKARGKTVSSNQDSLACALKADSCDDGSEFQEVDVFLGVGLGLCLGEGGNPGRPPCPLAGMGFGQMKPWSRLGTTGHRELLRPVLDLHSPARGEGVGECTTWQSPPRSGEESQEGRTRQYPTYVGPPLGRSPEVCLQNTLPPLSSPQDYGK